jgi:hypothetical protein
VRVFVQSFRCAHKGRMYVRVFIGVSAHTCMRICILYCVSKKQKNLLMAHSCSKKCKVRIEK